MTLYDDLVLLLNALAKGIIMDYKMVELSLELTNSCPLACVHCSSGSSPEALPDELTYAEHICIIKEARELGATVLSLSGGAPLNYDPPDMEHGLVKLVDAATSIDYRILIYVTGQNHYGNFIYDYPDMWELLGNPYITWIFSLHSDLDAVNDRIMGRNTALFEITESISWLKDAGETVEIHMVPMKPNFQDIPRVREMCRSLGISKMSCLRFVPQTRGKENVDKLGMSKPEFAEMQFILHKAFQRNGEHPVELRLGCPIDFRHAVGLLPEKRKPCHAGDDLILVRPQGDVHPCAAWKSLPADANVRRSSLASIWQNSEVFNAIRLFKTGKVPSSDTAKAPGYQVVSGPCFSCSMLNSCLTGCPAQRLHALDATDVSELYAPISDPLCPRGD